MENKIAFLLGIIVILTMAFNNKPDAGENRDIPTRMNINVPAKPTYTVVVSSEMVSNFKSQIHQNLKAGYQIQQLSNTESYWIAVMVKY
jgi:hypothetical protein